MSQPSQKGVSLPTMTPRKRYRVTFQDESTFEGTRREILEANPAWWKYAVEIGEPVAPAVPDDEDDRIYTTRLPSSSINYQTVAGQRVRAEWRPGTVVQRRKSALPASETEDVPQGRPRRKRSGFFAHPYLYMGIGMLFMLALWLGLQWLGAWWSLHNDDVTYGRPRTFQFDAVFGHNDSAANPTHIIIVNLNRHIIIIELPGGDPSHSRIYSGPTLFGDGQDLTPVTAKAIDVNGDGKLDLVLFVQDQRIVFINDGTQFRPVKTGEQITLPR